MVSGYIEKIKYRNEENGYTVMVVASDEDKEEVVMVGNFSAIDEGEYIEANGQMKLHPIYGEQLLVSTYEIKTPKDIRSIEKYLSSGAVKGVGEALAKRIIKKFKADTLRIMEEEPERLAEVKGISEKLALSIGEQIEQKKDMRDAMIFLQNFGISMNLAAKIYKNYGARTYAIISQNPYILADDIAGIGFKIADDIAKKMGVLADAEYRIKSGIIYILSQAAMNGHIYLPMEHLLQEARELLEIDIDMIGELLPDMQMDKKIIIKRTTEGDVVYASHLFYMELGIAKMLKDIDIHTDKKEDLDIFFKEVEDEEEIVLDDLQKRAVEEAISSGLLIITGGPGTGKTTVIKTIIRYFENAGMEVALAAPTGRAAKRMTEATLHEAKTIHRLLEIVGREEEESNRQYTSFERNEDNPLEADIVIIDEVSMVDIYLMNALLKAVSVGTRLILVGDMNQLPSVGPGNILRDIIESEAFNVTLLHRIYRQAEESDIIMNAHKIIDGDEIYLGKQSKDFVFIKREEPDAVISAILTLIKEKLPRYLKVDMSEIQIMSPMRKGLLGVERLNVILQENLNPPSPQKKEKLFGESLFREGDKVMQIKNNYQAEWEIYSDRGIAIDKGVGIYNGDIGRVIEINLFAEYILVEFDDKKRVEYDFSNAGELELAYAITIHKSQGSEYPGIIIPIYTGPRMLMTRNLIYTAITRAKSLVTLVGMPDMFYSMVGNTMEMKRYSSLDERIREIAFL